MAAQQPSVRPWSRLASIAARPAPVPVPAPQANPVPQPRPTFARPTFRPMVPLPTQLQQSSIPYPVAVAPTAAPRAQLPPTSVAFTPAPESRSPPARSQPTAVAPTPVSSTLRSSPRTVVSSTVTPLSQPTAVIPSPPPPAAEQLRATSSPSTITTSPITRTSLSTLSAASAAPKAPTAPNILPLSSPKPKVSAPASPLQKPTAPKQVSPVPASSYQITTTPATSPEFINPRLSTHTPSSEIRPIIHPPSPLTLPPAQLKLENNIPQEEIDEKYVIAQETKEKPRTPHKYSNSDHLLGYNNELHNTRNHNQKQAQNNSKDKHNGAELLNSEDLGFGLLTIAGENKGVVMELSHSMRKHDSSNHLQSPEKNSTYSTWREGYKSGSDSSEEGKSKNNAMARRKTTFMNSNVQGVNNSILCNVSYAHHDPGVQFSNSRKANGGGHFRGEWKNMSNNY